MHWLEPHRDALAAPPARVLDLGCGPGHDSAWLAHAGFDVVSTDGSPRALARTVAQCGSGRVLWVDHSRPLPFRDATFEAVVASLTLHYFTWDVTRSAMADIRRVLAPGGTFLFRVNATDDVEHGAAEGVEVEPHLRAYPDGAWDTTKRFFDEAHVRAALDGRFAIDTLKHMTIERAGRPKRVWECRARRLG